MKHVLFLLLKHQEPLGIAEGCATAEAQREFQELWGVGGEVQALNRGETQVQTLFELVRDWWKSWCFCEIQIGDS